MRKWLWIGSMSAVALGCLVIVWEINNHRGGDAPDDPLDPNPSPIVKNRDDDGNGEVSEVIEPIIVERWVPPPETPEPPHDDEPAPRVNLQPGMAQPPRPDEEPGKVLRMPYAD
jgi:hypothetical protein